MGLLQQSQKLPEFSEGQKLALALVFWEWFYKHQNDVLFKKTVVVFKITIKVKDLKALFEQLFGPQPAQFSEM